MSEDKAKRFSPFDFANSICTKDPRFTDDVVDSDYSAWMVNRALSMFPDTVFFANEMNAAYSLPKQMQYDFFFYGVEKRKRWSKWPKKDKSRDDKIAMIIRLYGYSRLKAEEVLPLIDMQEGFWEEIEAELNEGGSRKSKKRVKRKKA